MTSFNHSVYRLPPDQVDYFDRWGERCASGKCGQPATHYTSYEFLTGRYGRRSSSGRRACLAHAQRYATKHTVTIGDPPAARPSLMASVVSLFDPDPRQVQVMQSRVSGWCARETGSGIFVSGAFTAEMSRASTLDGAIAVVEQELARRKRLVPVGGWTRVGDSDRAIARFVKAEDTPEYAAMPWQVNVLCDPARGLRDRPTWLMRRILDERFKHVEDGLGNTGMDLDRALRTAAAILTEQRWQLLEPGWHRQPDGSATGCVAHPASREARNRA